ncbi:hypothetical protein ACFWNT_46130, partial [Streptomyces sp. NPDC058409]
MRTRKPPTDPGAPLSTTTIPIRATAAGRNPTADLPVRILRRAAHEFGLTGLLLLLVVTAVRWLLAPGSLLVRWSSDRCCGVRRTPLLWYRDRADMVHR